MATIQHLIQPGEYLFHDGDTPYGIYIIKRGTISIRKGPPNAYIEMAKVYSNEVVGELSFFDRLPRSASAVAITEVEAIEIDFVALDKIYGHVPDYFKTIMASVAERLRRADDTIKRLQKQLGNLSDEDSEVAPKEEPEDIASILAATTETSTDTPAAKLPKPDGDSDA